MKVSCHATSGNTCNQQYNGTVMTCVYMTWQGVPTSLQTNKILHYCSTGPAMHWSLSLHRPIYHPCTLPVHCYLLVVYSDVQSQKKPGPHPTSTTQFVMVFFFLIFFLLSSDIMHDNNIQCHPVTCVYLFLLNNTPPTYYKSKFQFVFAM